MIDLHYWTTPNGHKITIFLEETAPFPHRIAPATTESRSRVLPCVTELTISCWMER